MVVRRRQTALLINVRKPVVFQKLLQEMAVGLNIKPLTSSISHAEMFSHFFLSFLNLSLLILAEECEATAVCDGDRKSSSPHAVSAPAPVHPSEQETPKPIVPPPSKPAPQPAEGTLSSCFHSFSLFKPFSYLFQEFAMQHTPD